MRTLNNGTLCRRKYPVLCHAYFTRKKAMTNPTLTVLADSWYGGNNNTAWVCYSLHLAWVDARWVIIMTAMIASDMPLLLLFRYYIKYGAQWNDQFFAYLYCCISKISNSVPPMQLINFLLSSIIFTIDNNGYNNDTTVTKKILAAAGEFSGTTCQRFLPL